MFVQFLATCSDGSGEPTLVSEEVQWGEFLDDKDNANNIVRIVSALKVALDIGNLIYVYVDGEKRLIIEK